MTLNQYAAEKRLGIFDDLILGRNPREGSYDPGLLAEARSKGRPQMGTTQYSPLEIKFEFIYPDQQGASVVLEIALIAPERIVFLPVPRWVVENIWQGDIAGTHHFESEARRLVEEFRGELTPTANEKWFGPQVAKRRE